MLKQLKKNSQLFCQNNRLSWFDNKVNQIQICQNQFQKP